MGREPFFSFRCLSWYAGLTPGIGSAPGEQGWRGGEAEPTVGINAAQSGNSTCYHRGAGGGVQLSGARRPAKFLVFPHNFACQGGQGFL
jgi:hypothetical protein